MKVVYTKAVLYAYTSIEKVKRQIDDYVERRALASMNDYSPCDEQCEIIIKHMAQKVILTELKTKIRAVLIGLKKEDFDLLDYKYFKMRPKEYYENIDTNSRGYYRRQFNLIKKVSRKFDKAQLTDEWFEKNCLDINVLKWLVKREERREVSASRSKNINDTGEIDKNKSIKKEKRKSFKLSA